MPMSWLLRTLRIGGAEAGLPSRASFLPSFSFSSQKEKLILPFASSTSSYSGLLHVTFSSSASSCCMPASFAQIITARSSVVFAASAAEV